MKQQISRRADLMNQFVHVLYISLYSIRKDGIYVHATSKPSKSHKPITARWPRQLTRLITKTSLDHGKIMEPSFPSYSYSYSYCFFPPQLTPQIWSWKTQYLSTSTCIKKAGNSTWQNLMTIKPSWTGKTRKSSRATSPRSPSTHLATSKNSTATSASSPSVALPLPAEMSG